MEYDINRMFTVSAGAQVTDYNFTDKYMEDISYNVSSTSVGVGFAVNVSKKVKLNFAYFKTFYKDYNRSTSDYNNLSAMAGKVVGGVVEKLQGHEAAQAAVNATTQMLTTPNAQTGTSLLSGSDSFTRSNRVFGIGVDIKL